MVATLARLRLTIWRNALRREKWRMLLLAFGVLYGLAVLGLGTVGLFALGFSDPAIRDVVIVLAGSLLVLGWALVPVLAFGIDDTLDPQRFALMLTPSPRFAVGLLIAGAVSVPGAVTVLVCLASSLVWVTQGSAGTRVLTTLVALVTGALAAVLCLLLARATTTAAAGALRGRRGRDMAGIIGVFVVLALSMVPLTLQSVGGGFDRETFVTIANAAGWTPFGAPWGASVAMAQGDVVGALLRVLIVLAAIALAGWVYLRALRSTMTDIGSGGGASQERTGRLPFAHALLRRAGASGRVLGIPVSVGAAAVAGRSLRYWRADPRYLSNAGSVAMMPILALLLAFFISGQEGIDRSVAFGWASLVLAPVAAWMAGWLLHDDIAYDSTAFSLHLVTGVRGSDDRLGRLLAVAAWSVPLVLVLAVIPPIALGRGELVPAVLGISVALLGAGFGSSSYFSARTPYPVPPPGANPLSNQSTGVGLAMIVQFGSMLVLGVIVLPTALTLIPVFALSAVWGWLTLVVGVATGVVASVVGVRRGGELLDARAVDVLTSIRSWPKH